MTSQKTRKKKYKERVRKKKQEKKTDISTKPKTPVPEPLTVTPEKIATETPEKIATENETPEKIATETPEKIATETPKKIATESETAEKIATETPKKIATNSTKSQTPEKIATKTPGKIATYLEFPFLTHKPTIDHIKEARTLFLLRGLPGSGKSVICSALTSLYPGAVWCSADHFFIGADGEYCFDASKLKDAHASCQQKAERALAAGEAVVIIDNTNVRRWETTFYVNGAQKLGYTVLEVQPQTPWRFNASILAARTSHGVPEDVLVKKVETFQTLRPLYYAWFAAPSTSADVREMALAVVPEALHLSGVNRALVTGGGIPSRWSSHYTRVNPHVHCTAAFRPDATFGDVTTPYRERPDVIAALGQVSPLKVIGFTLTPRTISARLQLSKQQLPLFTKDQETPPRDANTCGWCLCRKGQGDPDAVSAQTTAPASDSATVSTHVGTPSCMCETWSSSRYSPTWGRGSRAHLTLGTIAGVKSMQAGFDQVDLIKREIQARDPPPSGSVRDTEDAWLRHYGDGVVGVYLKKPFYVTSTFSGWF